MHRFLFISLALVCLLAGCSAPQTSDPATDESDSLDAYFEEEPADNEMGSAEFGLQDPMDTVYTYDGESLEIPFSITGASFGKTTEIGVLLFVDGVAQPYSAVYEDGTELEESYMQVFNLDYEQQENFDMVFQPMTGKAGETVPVMAVTILEPSFVAEGPDNPRYGFHHQESATTSRQISFVADAPAQTLATAGTDYNVVDLPQDILDTLAAWGATDSLDTTATLSLGVEDGNYIQADGKTATIILLTRDPFGQSGAISSIYVDEDACYYASSGEVGDGFQIYRIDLKDFSTRLYFSTGSDNMATFWGLFDHEPTVDELLADVGSVTSFVVDGNYIYYLQGGRLYKVFRWTGWETVEVTNTSCVQNLKCQNGKIICKG